MLTDPSPLCSIAVSKSTETNLIRIVNQGFSMKLTKFRLHYKMRSLCSRFFVRFAVFEYQMYPETRIVHR